MTGLGSCPPRGNVTSLLSRDMTGPVINSALIALVPLTELMRAFIFKSDLIRFSRVSFEGLTLLQIYVCTRLYAQAHHRYPTLSLESITARQDFIRRACAPCGECNSCSAVPVFAIAQCKAVHHENAQCLQLARSRGYCVFHDPQLLSMSDPSSYAPCVAMTRSSIGCLNLYDTSLLVRSDHYCGHCGVYSKCFSLLGNGLRHLVIHVLDTDSDIYAAANDISLEHYQPAKAYGSDSINSGSFPSSGSIISICAACSAQTTPSLYPVPSDTAAKSASTQTMQHFRRDPIWYLMCLSSLQSMYHGTHAVSQAPNVPATPQLSLVMQ